MTTRFKIKRYEERKINDEKTVFSTSGSCPVRRNDSAPADWLRRPVGSSGGSAAAPAEKFDLLFAGSSTAGMHYRWVIAACNVINEHSDLIHAESITTAGSSENINLVSSGEVDLGPATSIVTYSAAHGEADWAGSPVTNLSLVYALNADYLYVCTSENSELNSIADLEGKRVSLDVKGNGNNTGSLMILDALDIDPETYWDTLNLSTSEAVSAIIEGSIDAFFIVGAPNVTAVSELQASKAGLKLFSLNDEERAKVAESTMFLETVLPADCYPGIPELKTIGGFSGLLANTEFDEDIIYEFVKVLSENHDQLVELLPFAADSTPENTVNAANFLPRHPGTERYLKELGLM